MRRMRAGDFKARCLATMRDIKATGEPVVVTGSPANDMSKLTAMSLVAGVDPILRAAPANGPDPLGGSWNLGDGGPPQ